MTGSRRLIGVLVCSLGAAAPAVLMLSLIGARSLSAPSVRERQCQALAA